MIRTVSFDKTTYNKVPHKFEGGTPNIAGVVAFGATIDYLGSIGLANIAAHEDILLKEATEKLSAIAGLRIIGTSAHKASVLSFVLDGIHPHDIGTILDQEGVAVRAGHHCTQPLMERFGLPATARASFGLYNTREEIDRLVDFPDHVVRQGHLRVIGRRPEVAPVVRHHRAHARHRLQARPRRTHRLRESASVLRHHAIVPQFNDFNVNNDLSGLGELDGIVGEIDHDLAKT